MAFKLPSFRKPNFLGKMKAPNYNKIKPAIPKAKPTYGSKFVNNGMINTTGVTKTYSTRGIAKTAAKNKSRINRLGGSKLFGVKPLRPANKRTFGQMINRNPKFGSVSKTR